MATADEVIVEFKASVGKYEADLRRSAATFERVTQAQQRQMESLERQMEASSDAIGDAFKGLAAIFSAQQVMKLVDDYKRLQNSLQVAGLEGQNLADVQSRLLQIGGKYGVSVNTLADLYGNLSQVSGELGASQQQVMRINEAVAQSLIVTGKSSQEASGAVLGLVQAFGNGKLQAEEWAQINEGGLRPLLEAAAASEKYGGSVQNLRKAVYDGKVTSQQFFQAILDGAAVVEGKAANATLTLEGAFTSLNNRLIEYVGTADATFGASAALSKGLELLSNNIGYVTNALVLIATAMGVRYVAAASASATSSIALAAANTRAALAAEALASATYQANAALLGEASAARLATASVTGLAVAQGVAARAGGALLAAVGGPVGAAVLALGAGIAVLSARQAEAKASSEALSASIEGQTAKFDAARQKKAQAAAETNNLTKKERDALTATANLTGEANLLANAWGRVAAQAKQAAIEQAKAAVSAARINRNDAQAAIDRRAQQAANNPANQSSGSAVGVIGRGTRFIRDTLFPGSQAAAAKEEKKERDNLNAAIKNEASAREAYAEVVKTSLNDFKQDAPAASTDDPKNNTGGTKAKPDAPDAVAAERDLARLRVEELQAKLDLATTAEQRADLQRQILAEERRDRVAEIAANKDLSEKQRKAALDAIDRLYGPAGDGDEIIVQPGRYSQRVNRDLEREQAQQAQDIADERFRAEQEILRNQYDLADSSAERKRLALASIDLEERYQRAQLQAVIDLEGANSAEGKRAQAGLDAVDEISAGRRRVAERANQSPLDAYRDRLDRDEGETSDMVEGYVVDELQHVRDSIRGGIEKQLGIKDPLISGLLNMLIEDVLIKPITDALSEASKDGSGAGGLLKSLGAAASKIFGGGRAIGGPVRAGTPYMVGESGREMFVPQQSGVIVPNHRLNGSTQPQIVRVLVQANDYFDARVDSRSAGVATPIARAESTRSGAASYAQGQQSAPGTMFKYQQLKG
ncbi:tape measure protein [Sphingobium yanoikuyae]|uniref:tape measure protein n=1 Tax=Sphingobium yanoikuyae TaxID=13690 RepID=UPI003F04BF39